VDRSAGDGFDSAVSTQHVHAGYDVDFARDKSCSDDLGQSTSPGSGCLSFAPSAEFSDTKVLKVVRQSRANASMEDRALVGTNSSAIEDR
jgi:hypothetical protein